MGFLFGGLTKSKWGFCAFYLAIAVGLVHAMVTGEVSHTQFVEGEPAKVLAYLLLGGWLVFGVSVLVNSSKTRRLSCLGSLQLFALVYFIQVIGFISYLHRVHWMLFVPGVLMLIWTALAYGRSFVQRHSPAECVECWEDARFLLTSDRPDRRGPRSRYCLKHFVSALSESLGAYKGRFVIVDRPRTSDTKNGMYFFYDPADMAVDSYSQDDIQAVRYLIHLLLDTADELGKDVIAVRIPADAVRQLGAEEPLFTRDLNTIEGSPLNTEDLIVYLEGSLCDFDAQGKTFSMNEPYAPKGIYLWHDYV